MAKYDPLYEYLSKQTLRQLILSFSEIENIIGAQLPNSVVRPQWWANDTNSETSHVQCKAWLAAGYNAYLVIGSSKVRFERIL